MTDYLLSLIPRLKNYSLELDKISKLYNQPWVHIAESDEFIKLIFQKDGHLLISKNGDVIDGRWELVSNSKSLLIEMNGKKRLYNHQFLDSALMILKLDNLKNDLFILANETLIPDLDIGKYIENKYITNLVANSLDISINSNNEITEYEKEILLENGQTLQIIRFLGILSGTDVRIDDKFPNDGFVREFNKSVAYKIREGRIINEYYIEKFEQNDKTCIEVGGSRLNGIVSGCPVWKNGVFAPDGIYRKGWFSSINVKDGLII